MGRSDGSATGVLRFDIPHSGSYSLESQRVVPPLELKYCYILVFFWNFWKVKLVFTCGTGRPLCSQICKRSVSSLEHWGVILEGKRGIVNFGRQYLILGYGFT